MKMADIRIQLGKPIKVDHLDTVITIGGLGRLTISKGSVEWLSSPKSVNQRKYTWKEFAALMQDNGKLAKKKSSAPKKASAKKTLHPQS